MGRRPPLWNSFQPCISMPPTEPRYSHFPVRRPIVEKRATHLGLFATGLPRRAHWRTAPRASVSCLEVLDPHSPSGVRETNARWAPMARCPSEGARMPGHPWALVPRTKAKQFQRPQRPSVQELDALSSTRILKRGTKTKSQGLSKGHGTKISAQSTAALREDKRKPRRERGLSAVGMTPALGVIGRV